MPTNNTPGVYIDEVSILPPSIAEVATAIPAFIGITEKGASGQVEVAVINTLLEYENRFGKAEPTVFTADESGALDAVDPIPRRALWYAINLYFKNGGGRCYVVSVDNYRLSPTDIPGRFLAGLSELERFDEPTLILMPEVVGLDWPDFSTLNQEALRQCEKLRDRFAILDVKSDAGAVDDGVPDSRNSYGPDNLAYGAAYYPYLQTTLTHVYDETTVTVGKGTGTNKTLASLASTQQNIDANTANTSLYNQIKKNLAEVRVVLPPSAAIAGIYARVDRERGVWKAPANVGVMSVIGPTEQITDDTQDRLNVDATSGKSINAIRAFTGRGTLVWGARTLAGNDNEWRYIPVRRLFIMIEESAKKATAFAVFEPNDATTWLKVKGMIDSYLYGLWEKGALQGAIPGAAYYVQVGLGKTMTATDVLEGRLTVEIGVAAVRPAEFITLRFSHKLAVS